MNENREYVTIARFNSGLDAQMARGALHAAGIDCELANEFSQALVGPVDFMGGHGGHMLSVPATEAERAVNLLRDTPAAGNLLHG